MEKVLFKPLYLQVKERIFERIIAGEWPPGTFMPNEFALAEQYGVSQGTLRKALEELTVEKHLIRYQGKGTTVADISERDSVFPFYNIYDKTNKRLYPSAKPLSCEIVTPTQELAEKLRISLDEKIVCTKRTRPLDELSSEIVALELVYIPLKYFTENNIQNVTDLPIRLYAFYISEFAMRVTSAVEEVYTVTASAEEALSLDVEENSPLLHVKRTSFDTHDRAVEYRECKINTEKYIYRVNIK